MKKIIKRIGEIIMNEYKCDTCKHEDECAEMSEQIAYCKAYRPNTHKKIIYTGTYLKFYPEDGKSFCSDKSSYGIDGSDETFEQSLLIHIKPSSPIIFFESVRRELEVPYFDINEYRYISCPTCQGDVIPTGKKNNFYCYKCNIDSFL